MLSYERRTIRGGGKPSRIAIIGAGISGLGVAWALHRHPERFDFRLYEAQAQVGGNAVTADMPQDDGSSIPFDISVTACIPSVYHHILLVMQQHGSDLVDTRFSYQETCFVTGLVAARQIGADYPFEDSEARKWFNFCGHTMYGCRFRKA